MDLLGNSNELIDLKVVGWDYDLNMTDELVIKAFKKTLINRGLNKDGIFHSDRGSYRLNVGITTLTKSFIFYS